VSAEKATALVLRTTDWSESSRIATLWTREFGKVRVLAKGGRRLKSNFDSALDLLTECSIVLLRKSSGSLDLLTEARVVRRFTRLRADLSALYAGYYVAELLTDLTEDYDPHPALFDEALDTLSTLGEPPGPGLGKSTGPRLIRFECVLLRELGYSPVLDNCAVCQKPAFGDHWAFSAAAGGLVCSGCQAKQRDRVLLSPAGWEMLRTLSERADAWQHPWSLAARQEVRQLLNQYLSYLLGRSPRLLSYLES
jgi:DNA repair protein RecO (recombination protein O)